MLAWSTSERSGFGGEGRGVVKLSKRARRVSVGDKSIWVVEGSNVAAEEAVMTGRNREGEGRLWRFRGNGETPPSLCDKFRTVGGALIENPFVEEVSACGGGVLAIVQFDGDSGLISNPNNFFTHPELQVLIINQDLILLGHH